MTCKGCGGTAVAAAARLTAPNPGDETQFIVDFPNGDVARMGWDEAQGAVNNYGAVIRNDPGMRSLAPLEEEGDEPEVVTPEVVDTPTDAADDAVEVASPESTEGAGTDE